MTETSKPESDPIEAVRTRCGCGGKTPLDRTVRPALAALRGELPDVEITAETEAGLLPNTERLERSLPDTRRARNGVSSGVVAAAFVDPERGFDAEAFGSLLSEVYREWAGDGGPISIRKGHSIQLETASESTVWGEQFRSVGDCRDGYRAINVDVIHALPGVEPVTQAAVAAANALNDCYTQGAADDRDIRPVVGVPAPTTVDRDRVRQWYVDALGPDIGVREPSIVTHDGRGWQFGASAAASTDRKPPVDRDRIEPGDELLIHRPLGALALYAGCVSGDCDIDDGTRRRAIEALSADHAPIARAIEATTPRAGERFDPVRHLKWAADVSGPGIGGLLDAVESAEYGVELGTIPLLDRGALAAVRDRWVVPDVTVETNGPIAAVGTTAAIDRFESRLSAVPLAAPARIGAVTATAGERRWDGNAGLEPYFKGGKREP